MARIYEGMFLLDNQVVREDWKAAKAIITDALAKNGATVHAARRWDERRLAYPIRGRQRATYLLAYYEMEAGTISDLRRDLDLNERVLRYLTLHREEVPARERELSELEQAPDFQVPAPPPDESEEGPTEEPRGDGEGDEESERPRRRRPEPVAVADDEDEEESSEDEE